MNFRFMVTVSKVSKNTSSCPPPEKLMHNPQNITRFDHSVRIYSFRSAKYK